MQDQIHNASRTRIELDQHSMRSYILRAIGSVYRSFSALLPIYHGGMLKVLATILLLTVPLRPLSADQEQQQQQQPVPKSCERLFSTQRKCQFSSNCDIRSIEKLRKQCEEDERDGR